MEECGDLEIARGEEKVVSIDFLDDVELAFEWLCTWKLLIEETDDEVDLRPRRPPDECRREDRGVNGAGESELRWLRVELVDRFRDERW